MSPKIPGTFKTPPQVPLRDRSREAHDVEVALVAAGALAAESWKVGGCSVIVAREPRNDGYGWHLSISHPSRYPTWDEVKTAVYGIPTVKLAPGRTFAQLLGNPTGGPWVDTDQNCFHLFEIEDPWRKAVT